MTSRTSAARPSQASPDDAYVGLPLWSGTGEPLGVVVGVELDRWGAPKHLRFVEPGSDVPRRAPLRVVRHVDEDGIHLAGPREGYHITRLRASDEMHHSDMRQG